MAKPWTPERREALRVAQAKERGIDPAVMPVAEIFPDKVIDSLIDEAEREGKELLPEETTSTSTETKPIETEVKPEWEPPEEHKANWFRKPKDDEDPWKPESPIFPILKRAVEKPGALNDLNHPLHPVFTESERYAQGLERRAREAESRIAELNVRLASAPMATQGINDPAKKVFGGISLEAIRSGEDPDNDFADYFEARQTYFDGLREQELNKSVMERQRLEIDTRDAEERKQYKAIYPDGNPDAILDAMVLEKLPDGSKSSKFEGYPTYIDLHHVGLARKAGGWTAYLQSVAKAEYERGMAEAVANINANGGHMPALKASDGVAARGLTEHKYPFSNEDGTKMTKRQIDDLASTNTEEFRRRANELAELDRQGIKFK